MGIAASVVIGLIVLQVRPWLGAGIVLGALLASFGL